MMHTLVDSLHTLYQSHADPVAAGPMKAYMRNQFEYLGINMPQQRALLKELITEQGLPSIEDLPRVLLELWDLPEREFQYAAQTILDKFEQDLPAQFINSIETLLTTKSWWDTVDPLAVQTVGTHFRRFPEVRERTLPRWRVSHDFWLRRTCILFQNKYKTDTDFSLLKAIILENLGSKEFFINKSIGWALREYTRVDPAGVRAFVAETPLAPLSAREALKWLNRREQKTS
jgi:3-methyladenine DNA glycosylase AlkD